jgi:ATP-dependent Lon protease
MAIEVLLVEGKGGVQVTGQVGEVMQESAQAAVSYIKSRARQLGVDPETFEKSDIHIHVPEGAIPKDGPSAGITMATALASALTRRPVRHEVGMSGEITLRGRVLAIGGVREKVLAAHRLKLKTVILPVQNRKDLVEIPRNARREMNLRLVRNMDTVLNLALAPARVSGVTRPPRSGRKTRPAGAARPGGAA